MTAAEHIALLRNLRATRQLRSDPLPEYVLHDILEVARWSGSAGNRQPWELVVVRDRGALQRLASIDGANAGHLASALVKLFRDNAATLTPDRVHSAFFDSHPPALERIGRLNAPTAGS